MRPAPSQNRLLSHLSADDMRLLAPHFEEVSLSLRQPIEAPNEDVAHAYFPDRGIISIVAHSSTNESIEAGLIGWEGMTGIPVVMGDDRSPHEAFVQLEGSARRIESAHLRIAMRKSTSLTTLLLHFVQAFNIQVSHTALANGRAKIEERLARWLLMVHDRTEGDETPLTHDFIALMLGVRRPGVTDALHALEGKALLRSTRGVVRIVDREGLEALAHGIYGAPEAAYERLIG